MSLLQVTEDGASIFPSGGCFFAKTKVWAETPGCVIMSEMIVGFFLLRNIFVLFLNDAPINFWLTQLITNFKYPSLRPRAKSETT